MQPIANALQAELLVPAVLKEVNDELVFAAALTEKRRVFAAVVHCLCAAP